MACIITYKNNKYSQQEFEKYFKNNFNEFVNEFLSQDIQGFKEFVNNKQFQKLTAEEKAKTIEQVTKEHRSITALKDLSAKLAHRIGGTVEFQNHPNVDWKGYNQGMKSVLNEAYMTPDTPFHEILAHPIIRAIKNKHTIKNVETYDGLPFGGPEMSISNELTPLYKSLLKELETGRGKEVFEQVKRDYDFKLKIPNKYQTDSLDYYINGTKYYKYYPREGEEVEITKHEYEKNIPENIKYTLEEQQEEAIVQLVSLMAADKLDAKKDATLISKLKELWKQISDFVKSLLRQDGIKIDELPITTTLNDLAEIMTYGNNKIILPGYKVEYSTPLGNKYDTLEEVNAEIRNLADADVEVDLSGVKINPNLAKEIAEKREKLEQQLKEIEKQISETNEKLNKLVFSGEKMKSKFEFTDEYKAYLQKYKEFTDKNLTPLRNKEREIYERINDIRFEVGKTILNFIEKNKEYAQSKEIIEQWKKENNIQYDPEEVYSRGQGFYSTIGAYSNLELDLLLKNLIQHIEDNKKAGGEFIISAFTKPIDKRLKHIEGTGDRVRFVIYPKSEHIKWAAPTDVYSGSVWDAHEKVSKDKKSELLGVSFTKAPALINIKEISPNLADIIDNLSRGHNELGIELTTDNFRIEYDDNIDYSTKKLIDNINKILDDKYGKLEKPEIGAPKSVELSVEDILENQNKPADVFDNPIIGYAIIDSLGKEIKRFNQGQKEEADRFVRQQSIIGIQPTQTRENTTSIESVANKYNILATEYGILDLNEEELISAEDYLESLKTATIVLNDSSVNDEYVNVDKWFINIEGNYPDGNFNTKKEAEDYLKNKIQEAQSSLNKLKSKPKKEYTQQALTNLKVAALKEVARKYPRSLITSKVVPINPNLVDNSEIQHSKIGSKQDIENFAKFVDKENFQQDYDNLNLDNLEVLKYLYEMSSKSKDFITFAQNVQELVSALRPYLSVDEILEKLHCL